MINKKYILIINVKQHALLTENYIHGACSKNIIIFKNALIFSLFKYFNKSIICCLFVCFQESEKLKQSTRPYDDLIVDVDPVAAARNNSCRPDF